MTKMCHGLVTRTAILILKIANVDFVAARGILVSQTYLVSSVVHRDIKPSNVLYIRQNVDYLIKISDLGLARKLDPVTKRLDRHSGVVGTDHYMAPEMKTSTDEVVNYINYFLTLEVTCCY